RPPSRKRCSRSSAPSPPARDESVPHQRGPRRDRDRPRDRPHQRISDDRRRRLLRRNLRLCLYLCLRLRLRLLLRLSLLHRLRLRLDILQDLLRRRHQRNALLALRHFCDGYERRERLSLLARRLGEPLFLFLALARKQILDEPRELRREILLLREERVEVLRHR